MNEIQLQFVSHLKNQLSQEKQHIQVVLGPRQVGKTTGVKQLLNQMDKSEYLYFSADGEISKDPSWLTEKWHFAKSNNSVQVLVIDEIQNVEKWSSKIKELWDEQATSTKKLKLILLGSSSLSIQSGLSETLAGRYFVHRVYHWNLNESHKAYGLTLDQFLAYGGYPGSYEYVMEQEQWLNYIKHSIIDAVIGRDILTQVRIKSPALFKQCFEIASSYPAQEISYTKLLGQLQDKGNTDQIKNYLEHFEGAFLLKQLFKYSEKKVLTKSSSPKLLPLCPALYSVGLDAQLSKEERGRSFEVAVGCELLRAPGELYYWREKNFEVDFVYKYGKKLIGIEVKSGRKKSSKGIDKFKEKFPKAKILIITPDNFSELKNLVEQ